MKQISAILILLGYAGLAVFGVFAMSQSWHMVRGGCIATVANSAACPPESNPLAFFSFHLDAFKKFSTATLASFAIGFLAIFFGLAHVLRKFFGSELNDAKQQLVSSGLRFSEQGPYPLGAQFIRWLALHENSPSVA